MSYRFVDSFRAGPLVLLESSKAGISLLLLDLFNLCIWPSLSRIKQLEREGDNFSNTVPSLNMPGGRQPFLHTSFHAEDRGGFYIREISSFLRMTIG